MVFLYVYISKKKWLPSVFLYKALHCLLSLYCRFHPPQTQAILTVFQKIMMILLLMTIRDGTQTFDAFSFLLLPC